MKIEQWSVERIHPYENNPRLNDGAVAAVAKSIREFGFRQPIVVDAAGVIVCGHTRYRAALELGLERVPVHIAADLTADQTRAYRIADNRSGESAEWDYQLLPLEIAELRQTEFDLSTLGFDELELVRLLEPSISDGQGSPDEIPDPPDTAVTQPGDLWQLGDHRLLCGDSARAADVDCLLGSARIQLVNTDPPYNVRVEPRSNNAVAAGLSSFEATPGPHRKKTKLRPKDRPLTNDFVSEDEFNRLLQAWFVNIARVLEPGRAFYIWGGYANVANYPPVMKALGLYFSQAIIWVKQHPVLTRKDFMGNHEWCFYGWREGAAHQYFGPANAVDVWPVHKMASANMVHLTEKPVELATRAIQYSSRVGENVLDLFGGSGSTLMACHLTGRQAYLMEVDPLYCDVIVRRWETFTGRQATRTSNVCQEAVCPILPLN